MSDNNMIEKVSELDIIVTMIGNKPYYEIKYKNIGENYYHIGYSSYSLEQVLEYRNTYFEIVHEKMSKMTNADRIRSMSDEELEEIFRYLNFYEDDGESIMEIWLGNKQYLIGDEPGSISDWLKSPYHEISKMDDLDVRR